MGSSEYDFVNVDGDQVLRDLGSERLLQVVEKMSLIRRFERRAELAYQKGKVGGFFHAYTGQEAIQVAATEVFDLDGNYFVTTYRCHALALLTGATPDEVMAELYGKESGNAKGRGGSMHLYSSRMLGGFGIVGGHLPIAAGAAFALKYRQEEGVALCFLGDGAVPQGVVHETLNLSALWDLPAIYIIENNRWGMGTAVERAVAQQPIAQSLAQAYGLPSYTLNGHDFCQMYGGLKVVREEFEKRRRPILVEAVTERFCGHSISDAGEYRTKEELDRIKQNDPIAQLIQVLGASRIVTEEQLSDMEERIKARVQAATEYAEQGEEPPVASLEEGVLAP